ncbi:MAG: type I DNA topoisomerase [Parachlamydiaceae bacterium]|nr:type I DNA topoisomerase [Parachlamydiaceae bacterium]
MAKNKILIIVESPSKIKTLRKFLGDEYLLESSVGHIRDLPEKEFGIDLEHDFEPTYVTMPDKVEVIAKLKKAAKLCQTVYLSPDPDREGEAIAWHIAQILPPEIPIERISFNSLTKETVLKAIEQPRQIDLALVNAQQARRLLDRMVGYKISPILNRRIQRGKEGFVSAGRVQSVALKLVVDREKEIEAFKPVEYWNLAALLKGEPEGRTFKASLYSVDGKRVEKEVVEGKDYQIIGDKEKADAILAKMKDGPYVVQSVDKKEKKRNAPPPFITSTLQQEASRHHGFSSAKTMSVAQKLYEGIDLGNDGPEGLITYMRTDSVRIAPEGLEEARGYILQNFGPDFLPAQAKAFSTQKNAQDAHEAIRPSSLLYPPEQIEKFLTREQFMLYQLIWRRFVASQMMPAIYDTVSADIAAGNGVIVRATGSTIKFQGYLILYQEKNDDDDSDEDGKILPPLEANQRLILQDLSGEQAFTRPPPRYTEASLVKELERSGIGRPSTYATIMNKIQSRDYTVKESGRLKPTELGRVIAELLEANFQLIMNIGFTAQMEDNLELVADGGKDWKALLREFWEQFSPTLALAEKGAFVPKVLTDIDCPTCGSKLQKIWFKNKYFYGCSKYPDCTYSAPIEEVSFNKDEYSEDFAWEQKCPKCGKDMKLRHGRFGAFLGCTGYPECKTLVNIPKKGEVVLSNENMPDCPAMGCPGKISARKSRFGKTFYSCSTFPECDVIGNTLEQLQTKYVDHPRTAYVGKPKGKGKGTAKGAAAKATTKATKASTKAGTKIAKADKADKTTKAKKVDVDKPVKVRKTSNMPPQKLSAELAAVVGKPELSRSEVTKELWVYIKEHNLQDPKNRRLIVPDEKLSKIFGNNEPLDMFKLAGVLNKHFT